MSVILTELEGRLAPGEPLPEDGRIYTRILRDSETGLPIIEKIQDAEPVIEDNKRAQNEGNNGFSVSRDFRHVARIPHGIINQLSVELGINLLSLPPEEFERIIRRLVNDPDYRWLRPCIGRM